MPYVARPARWSISVAVALATTAMTVGPVAPGRASAHTEQAPAPRQVQTTSAAEQPRIPRHLVHHNFKKATPTRWCARHHVVCVRELARRFHTFLARHPGHRSDWGTAAKRRAWHHRYIRAWKAKYQPGCAGTTCTKRRTTAKARSLADDWSRFSRPIAHDHGCDFTWMPTYRSPQFPDDPFYGFDCRPHVTKPSAHVGTKGKIWMLCQAGALVSGGTLAVATGGVTTPVVLSVVSQSTDCATVWSLMHALNWP